MILLDEWHVLLKRYRLMESPHGELGSNTHIILGQKEVFKVGFQETDEFIKFYILVNIYSTFYLSNTFYSSTTITNLERIFN
jgi:hypothetical protein